MKPFKDQQKSIDEIFDAFNSSQRVLYQLSTGGGKTAIFSFIAKKFIKDTQKKVLVCAHRDKLIDQTLKTLRTIGVTCESVVASKKTLQHRSNCYVAMIQTLKNRLKNNPLFVKEIELVICDEAHLDIFKEVFDYFPDAKILAVTATPISLKKISYSKCSVCNKEHDEVVICCNRETYEYSRQFTYSEIYYKIIIGENISSLIMNDRLVKDVNYEVGSCNRDEFTIDSKTGDFDSKSTEKYFGKFNVVKNYEEICKGEKTIIFNSSTTTNLKCYNDFIDAGYTNVRLIDSKNTKKSEVKPILEWYKNTTDAILLNCDVLTAGFDEPTIRAVILNRSTLSLSLYLQMVGRGGRICNTEFKPIFKVIDGGGNIQYFANKYNNSGKWSDEYDWEGIFYGKYDKPKPKKEPLDQTKECQNCGAVVSKTAVICDFCETEFAPDNKKREQGYSDEVARIIDEIPLPDGNKIVQYCNRLGRDRNFALTVLINQVLDLFFYHNVSEGCFINTVNNGKFEMSIRNIIKEPYQTIYKSELEGVIFRRKSYIIDKIKKKLNEYYSKK